MTQKCLQAREKFTKSFVAAVECLFTPARPAELVQTIALRFKNLGGIVGTLEDALNDSLPLGELVDIASRFKGNIGQFHEMVNDLLLKVQGGLFHGQEGDAVNMLTFFKAKGRQWHTVIIPGANQKVIPHTRSNVEDERRLFYVAVTRATHNLLLSYVRQAVRVQVEPSQFLGEMGLGKGDEKRAGMLGNTPDKTKDGNRTLSEESPRNRPGQTERDVVVSELMELLDETVFPAVSGTEARGSRRDRLDRWREAIADCPVNPAALNEALASCDSGIATGKDGRKVKLAIETWWRGRIQ